MIRILSVLATVMLLNVLGLFLLQGRSGVGKAARNFRPVSLLDTITLLVSITIAYFSSLFSLFFYFCTARCFRCLGRIRVQPRWYPGTPPGVWPRGPRWLSDVRGHRGKVQSQALHMLLVQGQRVRLLLPLGYHLDQHPRVRYASSGGY